MNRREIREAAFLLLYQSQLNDDSFEEIIENNKAEFELTADAAALAAVIDTAKRVAEYAPAADEIITRYSKTRKIARIAKITLSIMRLALYEMDNDPLTPDKAAINEAIELCKKYADDSDRSFVSGVLGSYFKDKQNE